MTFRRLIRLIAFAGLTFVAAACGGSTETESGGVASAADLEGATTTTEAVDDVATADADTTEITAEEAGLALAVCMRENGFADFPDPEIGDNGALNLRQAITDSGINFGDPNFQTQIQDCAGEVGVDNLGGGGNRADVQNGIQENLLVYTQCLRDEGLDVGDLDFGGGPGAGAGNGAGGNGGDGAGNGAGGNRGDGAGGGRAQGNGGAGGGPGARIAQFLGLDADDPDTAAALNACEDVLADAFAGIGGGPGGGGGAPAAATTDT